MQCLALEASESSVVPNHVRAERAADRLQSLTARQRQVLGGIVDGLLNKQIAGRLGIDEKTVKMHRAALLVRLHVPNSAAAIRLGVEASFAPFAAQKAPLRLASTDRASAT